MRVERLGIGLRTERSGEGLLIKMAYLHERETGGTDDTEWYPIRLSQSERLELAIELVRGTPFVVSKPIKTRSDIEGQKA